ncbi:hypothetical protein [Chryseobacterium oryctis]|uniref:DUF4468 domain-containing protein n=1 Tax=Chryseobacterium oryctis TaxID=2952618 RepID=A0ABT3HSS7_9FLAO|nr:hypothetical protein [Chryseobacterium oryctis]MCW3162730.1 hypothetical protein [Chryseobacterium oryctis]
MKKISILIFTFCLTLVFGQKVSNYKYIAVPEKFETFKRDYGIVQFLTKSLNSKKYEVISTNKHQWPEEIYGNGCNIIFVAVKNESNWLTNKLTLQFKDCNDKVILESKGRSDIKEYEEGYQDALKQALTVVSMSSPTIKMENNEEVKYQEPIKKDISNKDTVSNTSNSSSKFTNGKITLQKIQLDNNQFILADSNSSVPFATFKNTTKKDVFRVKLANGESTLGYFENGNIVIEIPQSNGEHSKEVFSVK